MNTLEDKDVDIGKGAIKRIQWEFLRIDIDERPKIVEKLDINFYFATPSFMGKRCK